MLIQCPECGHQVSDKAPVCPNCGIEIAGHVDGNTTPAPPSQTVAPEPRPFVAETQPIADEYKARPAQPASAAKPKKQRDRSTLWISFLIAAVACAAMLYFYKDAVDRKAGDKVVNMERLKTMKEDVDSSLVDPNYTSRNTSVASQETADNAETSAKAEQTESTAPSESTETTEKTSSSTQPTTADMEKATQAVRRFFRAINSHDKEALSGSVSPFLSSFNGKECATKLDVQKYMTDLYQADVKNLNWYIGDIKSISKREVGENRYEYDITLEAKKVTERQDGTSTHNFTVKAMVEDDGKIGSMNINRK